MVLFKGFFDSVAERLLHGRVQECFLDAGMNSQFLRYLSKELLAVGRCVVDPFKQVLDPAMVVHQKSNRIHRLAPPGLPAIHAACSSDPPRAVRLRTAPFDISDYSDMRLVTKPSSVPINMKRLSDPERVTEANGRSGAAEGERSGRGAESA